MSNLSGNMFLNAFMALLVAILRMAGVVCGYVFKFSGLILTKLSELTFNLCQK